VAEISACHTFSGEAFNLSPEIRKSQSQYLREVRSQLGVTSDEDSTIGATCTEASPVTLLQRAS
jgi:hypothetical protein